MSGEDTNKEHEATSKRLDELREMGQTLRSKDLSSGIILATTLLILMVLSGAIRARFEENFNTAFTSINIINVDPDQLFKIMRSLFVSNLMILIPIFAILMVASFLSVFILGGWNFSIKAVGFKWEKLNPVTNLGNIFSKRMFGDIAKSSVKFAIIVGFFYYFAITNDTEILSLSNLQYTHALYLFCALVERFIVILFIGILVIIGIDALSNYLAYQTKTKMSTQELKDEQKNTEGNTDVKRRMRSLQYSLLKQRIPLVIPKATVIITNPTHYAVALQYIEGKDKAPKVIAKGKDNVAAYIRKLAIASGVPVYDAPPLARSIYHTTKVGSAINPALYMAVAIVLTYINQLRRYQSGQGPMPVKVDNFEIPPEFQFK